MCFFFCVSTEKRNTVKTLTLHLIFLLLLFLEEHRSVPEPVGDGQELVGLLHGLDLGVRLLVHGLVAAAGVIQELLPRGLKLPNLSHLQQDSGKGQDPTRLESQPPLGHSNAGGSRSCMKGSDLLWSHQQQLGDGRGGGHGVPVHSVDLEGSGHAPHPLVGGQNLLITDQNSVWVFDCGQTAHTNTSSWKFCRLKDDDNWYVSDHLSASLCRGWSWRSFSSSSWARCWSALCPFSLALSPRTMPRPPPHRRRPPLPPHTRPLWRIFPPPGETPAWRQLWGRGVEMRRETLWYLPRVADGSSPVMLRRLRDPTPWMCLRVIPDLVVMGEGGEGEPAGWPFTALWESPHQSDNEQTS